MCLCCLKCNKHIELMMSKDNPNRICKENSTCNCIGSWFVWIFTIAAIITAYYFFTIWFGYGWTAAAMRYQYNMDTGYSLDPNCGRCRIICRKDYADGLYGGCLVIGFICEVIFVVIIIGIIFVTNLFCDVKSEVVKASDTAKNMDAYGNPQGVNYSNEKEGELKDVKVVVIEPKNGDELSNVELDD
jgi:hypothetical protein